MKRALKIDLISPGRSNFLENRNFGYYEQTCYWGNPRAPTHDHRLANQGRLVSFLDRGIERVHVNVKDHRTLTGH